MTYKHFADSTSRAPEAQRSQRVTDVEKSGLGNLVTAYIDNIEVKVPMGTTILEAAKKVNIKIPTLCYHDDLCLAGVCRVCVVEVEGQKNLQASCSYPMFHTTKVKTYSPRVRRARHNILNLLLKNHYGECYSCERNNNCELQELAKEYNVIDYKFGHVQESRIPKDESSFSLVRDMDKCILCKRCVRTCIDLQEVGVLEAVNRGSKTQIQTYLNKPLADVICINCGQCVDRCPTGALTEKKELDKVWAAIDNPDMHVVIQTAPSPRAAIGEEFEIEAGHSCTKKLNTAIKRVGFDKVFDTNFTADLTIMEEGTELLLRLKSALVDKNPDVKLPLITSCSPGWVKFIEHFYPEKLDHLSTAKSPQQMFGTIVKTWYAEKHGIDPKSIFSVSLMPCTAKKYECARPEMYDSGSKDVDVALTTRELACMIRESGVDLPNLPESNFDDPLGVGSGAGLIFAATGGVMEAAMRTAYELVTGRELPFENLRMMPVRGEEGIKKAQLIIENTVEQWKFLEGAKLNVIVGHGTANAKRIMDMLCRGELDDCHFIEIMACPGGCLGGGGQPIPTNAAIRRARAAAIYNEEEHLEYRKSHENPIIKAIYDEYFTEGPCSHLSHKLLHTSYTKRGKKI
ncbi:NADP-reducing hydrogenase subunit HndC [Limihaloglobus sulfuriphilus]|uniref:NADP-reducing hydrogenase subunit HndC n=1 Tax=Limihaloglobus sulfuriphilus TaxID=1851148 RepID=A0A1Q2MB10_9BACT|nr:NADH-dependent [FeFe] hydrogenase, group A6 [Limihaloglobus sulfuriphilus]AQQ69718.1 NADP-reducing hydrogenase subunit HndC [Limihaloglobus sulfuriphilus]